MDTCQRKPMLTLRHEPTQGWVYKQPFYLDEESKAVLRQYKEDGLITALFGGGAVS